MATAAENTITTWLALRAACELTPEPVLVRRLGQEKSRSRGLTEDGTLVEISSQFWRRGPIIDRDRNSARSRFLSPVESFYRIEVLCDDTPPLPGGAQNPADLDASSSWVVAELKNMQVAGEISPGATITNVSKELATRMLKVRPMKALKARSIENMLRDLKLWPVTPVK